MSCDHKDVGDSLFHRDCKEMTLVLFLLDLIQSLHMDAVEVFLYKCYRHVRSDVHRLLLAKTDVFVLSRIYATYSNCVICSVILEALDLECACHCLVLCFNELTGLFLDSPVAFACDKVVNVHDVVDVPHVIRIPLDRKLDSEYFVSEVN